MNCKSLNGPNPGPVRKSERIRDVERARDEARDRDRPDDVQRDVAASGGDNAAIGMAPLLTERTMTPESPTPAARPRATPTPSMLRPIPSLSNSSRSGAAVSFDHAGTHSPPDPAAGRSARHSPGAHHQWQKRQLGRSGLHVSTLVLGRECLRLDDRSTRGVRGAGRVCRGGGQLSRYRRTATPSGSREIRVVNRKPS